MTTNKDNNPQGDDERITPSDDPSQTINVPLFKKDNLPPWADWRSSEEAQTTDHREALKQAIEREKLDPKWGRSRFTEEMALEVWLHETDKRDRFSYDNTKKVLIGRRDPRVGFQPHVDLSAFNAEGLGVSRQHAMIERHEGVLMLVDLGSRNGTYLNGKLVRPNDPRIVRSGDEIRVGYILLHIRFAPATQ